MSVTACPSKKNVLKYCFLYLTAAQFMNSRSQIFSCEKHGVAPF